MFCCLKWERHSACISGFVVVTLTFMLVDAVVIVGWFEYAFGWKWLVVVSAISLILELFGLSMRG